MADENKTHVLMADCIISEFGRCSAGTMLSASDVHSETWSWLERQGFLKSVESIEQEADSDDEQSSGSEVSDETPTTDLLTRVKALLAESKLHKSSIAKSLECDEAELDSLLTEANGIDKHAGWYSLSVPAGE